MPRARPTRTRPRRRRNWALFFAAAVLAIPAPLLTASDGTRGKMSGVVVTSSQSRGQAAVSELARTKEMGANTAATTIFWDADQESSSVQRGGTAISDADLEVVIRRARQLGLRVVVELMLKCYECDPAWRGAIEPRDVGAFFRSYREYVNHYSALSQSLGVEVLFVGSEMSTLQHHDDEWREVIRQARQRFQGKIAYEGNWDAFDTVPFWDAVDIMGISAYFPLSDERQPTLGELKAGWQKPRPERRAPNGWFRAVEAVAKRTGKPVMFGEVGYRSTEFTGKQPWVFNAPYDYNAENQVNAYQALLETFEGQPWWLGVLWWEWLVIPADEDTTYSPRNKPAEEFLRRWWREGWRPSAADSTPGSRSGGSSGSGGSAAGGSGGAGDGTGGGRATGTGAVGPDGTPVTGPDGHVGGVVIGARPGALAEGPAAGVTGVAEEDDVAPLAGAAGLLLVAVAAVLVREYRSDRRVRRA